MYLQQNLPNLEADVGQAHKSEIRIVKMESSRHSDYENRENRQRQNNIVHQITAASFSKAVIQINQQKFPNQKQEELKHLKGLQAKNRYHHHCADHQIDYL